MSFEHFTYLKENFESDQIMNKTLYDFFLQYFTNAALARTSVATTTILFSTSGLFTLILDACLERQSLTIVNVVAVIVSMAGVAMTTVGKTWAQDEPQSSSSGYVHNLDL